MKKKHGTALKVQMPWNVDSEMRLFLCASVVRTLQELDERDRARKIAKRKNAIDAAKKQA